MDPKIAYTYLSNDEVSRFYDVLQASIIIVGGCRIPFHQLADMKLADLVSLIYPNGIRLKVELVGYEPKSNSLD